MSDSVGPDRAEAVTEWSGAGRESHRALSKRIARWLAPSVLTLFVFVIFVWIAGSRVDRLAAPGIADDQQGLQLKTLIRQVKKELQEADVEAMNNNEAALFELKDFVLDVNVVAKGKIGGDAQILTIGTNAEVSRERIQHIHLRWVADPKARATAVAQAKIRDAPTDVIDADEEQRK